jgi:acetolactate synthase-1/2/3 large subunit
MSGAETILTECAEAISAAVATSLSGKGSIAENHPLSVGVVGAMGTPSASAALDAADVVFLVATKAGSGPTFSWTRPRKDQIVIQLDIDPVELGRVFPLAAAMFADARNGLQAVLAEIARQGGTPVDRTQWRKEIDGFNRDWREQRDSERKSEAKPILPQRVLGDLESALGPEDIVVCDASLSSGWAGVYLEQISVGRRVLMPRGLAGLGYSLPAAIGVAMANRDRRTIVLTGDGALGYSVGEFATVLELQLPITVIVLNNRSLGWIRWYSRINFESGWQKDDFADIDYSAVAKAYGWSAERVVDPLQLSSAIKQALNSKEPSLLDIVTETWTTPVAGHRRALDLGTTTGYGG